MIPLFRLKEYCLLKIAVFDLLGKIETNQELFPLFRND